MIFNKNKTIQEITKVNIDEEHYNLIDQWKAIYKGYFNEWHDIKYHTLDGTRKRRMKTLNMAKVVTETLSKIVFTEKVEINISDEKFGELIRDVFKRNRFYKVFQNKLEQMFALGGLILKVNPKETNIPGKYKLTISYVMPDCFIPLSYENEEVTEGVFLNITKKKDKVYCLFEFHEWKGETYSIRNELYENDKNAQEMQAKRIPLEVLYENLEEQIEIIGLSQPLFSYIKPNVANNIDLQSPLGVSIFANALDTLYAIDVAFDSFIREFNLGKRRIIVPSASVRAVVDPKTGEMNRYFDANDEVYEAFNYSDPDKQKIMDNTVGLRVEEHTKAINSLLELLSMQIGFSSGTFTFDGQSVKTATEVVSEQSQTYQTKQANENLIDEGLSKFIKILGEVAELYDIFDQPNEEYEIEFNWDDSIIKDKHTESDFYIKLKNSGLIDSKYALMKILEFTEEQADEMIQRIKDELVTMTPDINQMMDNDMDNYSGETE